MNTNYNIPLEFIKKLGTSIGNTQMIIDSAANYVRTPKLNAGDVVDYILSPAFPSKVVKPLVL